MASPPFASSNPRFWLIAGPNGVGKSSWVAQMAPDLLGEIPILNPDHFNAAYTDTPLSLVAAGKRIFLSIKKLVLQRKSFGVETTLSGSQYFRLADKLKREDWKIGAVFVGVSGADICLARVKERALSGGHDVPNDDIIRRYTRSYQHIPRLLEIADYILILDNSYTYQQLLEKSETGIIVQQPVPLWLKEALHL